MTNPKLMEGGPEGYNICVGNQGHWVSPEPASEAQGRAVLWAFYP